VVDVFSHKGRIVVPITIRKNNAHPLASDTKLGLH